MNIELANGKTAIYKSTRTARIPDLGIDEETDVHTYMVPCPVCDHTETNLGHSHNGITFLSNQIICRVCGVFFRPVSSPDFIRAKRLIQDVLG